MQTAATRTRLLLTAATYFCFVAATDSVADEGSANLSIVLKTTSDWLYRGVSESEDQPAVGVNLDWQPHRHLFLGVGAHEARFDSDQERQRHSAILGYLGTGASLGDSWYGTLTLSHREFPGAQKEWDFSEIEASVTHRRGLTASIAFSPDYYEHDTEALHFGVGFRHRFRDWLYGFVDAGVLELSADRFQDYRHARIGAGASLGRLNVEAAYAWTSARPSDDFGRTRIDSPGLVLSLAYRVH